jgi:hypothetical protein
MGLEQAIERLRLLGDDPSPGVDEQTRRTVAFAHNGHGNVFAWDPQEVTDPHAPEFGMYAWYCDDFHDDGADRHVGPAGERRTTSAPIDFGRSANE